MRQWDIDLLAKNPKDAARKALGIQRDKNSIATVFDISDGKDIYRIDLEFEE